MFSLFTNRDSVEFFTTNSYLNCHFITNKFNLSNAESCLKAYIEYKNWRI